MAAGNLVFRLAQVGHSNRIGLIAVLSTGGIYRRRIRSTVSSNEKTARKGGLCSSMT
jgi:hypothetical protein